MTNIHPVTSRASATGCYGFASPKSTAEWLNAKLTFREAGVQKSQVYVSF